MECNKEEAIRAKGIAEKKMENKDFVGARKIAIKAQQLYPDLENICQIICVCDVHCSGENRNLVNEKDWYGILQVEQSADDALIRKQYRKLALLLHPDKNKFAGAEAAFKLIGEAQRVLLDREKRSFYDARYRRFSKNTAPNPPQGNRNANTTRQPWGENINSASSQVKSQPQQQAHAGVSNGKETFWTLCPFCAFRYQYYKDFLNKALRCQSCKKPFIAYDMCAQWIPSGSSANPTAAYTQVKLSNQFVNPNTSNGQGNTGHQTSERNSFAKSGQSAEVGRSKKTNEFNMGGNKVDGGRSDNSRKDTGKRGKKRVVESSESFQSESSTDSEDVEVVKGNGAMADSKWEGDSNRRRSSRLKQHVSYNESGSDDEDIWNKSKRSKSSAPSSFPVRQTSVSSSKEESTNFTKPRGFAEEIGKSGTGEANGNECVGEDNFQRHQKVGNDCVSDSNTNASETMMHEVPDPDFNDFDQIRKEDCFKVGQIWAVYDTTDAMPRFYARIRKVFSSGFKLRITWLEPDPDEGNALLWVSKELPFSCGKFTHGTSENTEDCLMFSHPMTWEMGCGKDSIKIYPKKEETWALFCNWHMDWMSNPNDHRKYEYEFVEILSEYDESAGIRVAFLGKLKGFVCVFCRKSGDEIQISPNEILRFSHRVPSYRMTGKEREDVPSGSFELDPASVPLNLEEMPLPKEMKLGMGIGDSAISNPGSLGGNPGVMVKEKESACQNDQTKIHDKHQSTSNDVAEHATKQPSTPEAYEIPEPDFYNFEATKSLDTFQVGQIWALYSDEDGLPRYYGLIKKVDHCPEFQVQVAWLQACLQPNNLIMWRNKGMPICCGQFRTKGCRYQSYIDSSPFSHQLRAETSKSNVFEIYPRKGETWALYQNWNVGMPPSDLQKCDYDIVEILEQSSNGSNTKVLVLERVPGYRSVFKAQIRGGSLVTMEIPHTELLRFSHQVPSHELTEEIDGSLKGFKELDTAALPVSFFLPKVR